MFNCLVINFLIVVAVASMATICSQELEAIKRAQGQIVKVKEWVQSQNNYVGAPSNDCLKFYNESEVILSKLLVGTNNYTIYDANIWLSGVLTYHMACLDGLIRKGSLVNKQPQFQNFTNFLNVALSFYAQKKDFITSVEQKPNEDSNDGILVSWDPKKSKADLTVAKDGSGTYKTINDAIKALNKLGKNRSNRVIIYVKEGIYEENVEIEQQMTNVMFVGDGISKTIVTSNLYLNDSGSLEKSATFVASGDGFWARDITFQNTAGPSKQQAVALMVTSDQSVFYRCSIEGFQDTLYAATMRQFYRDCYIYGTIDFIFGNAAVVIQNCDIYLRKPLDGQSNVVTAQGRTGADQSTAIVIQKSRIRASESLRLVQNRVRSYLGRPWKMYSRTIVMESYTDGVIDPSGWTEWNGQFGLSTLYYAEYRNIGSGSSTKNRVNWPGFHVLNDPNQANQFTVKTLIQGDLWIPHTGVPFWSGL